MDEDNNLIPSESPAAAEFKSYADWLDKYYPTPAQEFIPSAEMRPNLYYFSEYGEKDKITAKQKAKEISALKHSILKWEGLRPETLAEYGCYYMVEVGAVFPLNENIHNGSAATAGQFKLNGASCALCALKSGICGDCSIAGYLASTGEMEIPADGLDCLSQYSEMCWGKNPEPMISLLNETLKWVEGLETKNENAK